MLESNTSSTISFPATTLTPAFLSLNQPENSYLGHLSLIPFRYMATRARLSSFEGMTVPQKQALGKRVVMTCADRGGVQHSGSDS